MDARKVDSAQLRSMRLRLREVEAMLAELRRQREALRQEISAEHTRLVREAAMAVAALDHNSAFIAENVFEVADALRHRTTRESMDLRLEQPFTSEWYDRGDAAIADVARLANAVSAAIRQRVQSLVIADGEGA
jgi:hypothetical protein